MGVNGLWTVVQPCARPTNLATLNRKRLAVDASIWIYQFLKAVRDKEGNALRNSHVVGFFRRICKLLWFGIQPVFVFDGGAPALKRATIQGRQRRREGRRDDAFRTAGKLLAVQMQRMAEEEEERRKRGVPEEEHEEAPQGDVVYAEEIGMSQQERQQGRSFRKQDAYHLPELDGGIAGMAKPEDPRIMSVQELEDYAKQFHDGEDLNLYDFSKIDFDGDFFKSLPAPDRYNILNAARLRSRLRMGLSKEQLDDMFPNRMDFSRFQIERVKERNHLTQRLMKEAGMTGLDLTIGGSARVAGDSSREYILVKNDGVEGGWALGVVSKDKDVGEAHKPIDVDAIQVQYQNLEEEEGEEDDDFEDVPIEGLNRLPKRGAPAPAIRTTTRQRPSFGHPGTAEAPATESNPEGSLFVGGEQDVPARAIDESLANDENEDLERAIAMSLRNQHGNGDDEDAEEEEFEDVPAPAPEWKQRAVDNTTKPITSKKGSMIAHIVNNRSSAAVPKRQEETTITPKRQPDKALADSESDSEDDMQAVLAKARKAKRNQPAPLAENKKNPFDGPLPFPKLDLGFSLFGKAKKPETAANGSDSQGGFSAELNEDDDAGGFEKEDEDAPKPLPPWMVDETDIRESVQKQREADREINMEDRLEAEEEQRMWQKQRKNATIEIDDESDDGSDVMIVEKPQGRESKADPEVVEVKDSPEKMQVPSPGAVDGDDKEDVKDETTRGGEESVVAPLKEMNDDAPAKAESTAGSPAASPELDFEDVEIQEEASVPAAQSSSESSTRPSQSPEPEFEDVRPVAAPTETRGDGEDPSPAVQVALTNDAPPLAGVANVSANPPTTLDTTAEDDAFFNDADEDEFSDPGDEELLASLAEEAEEHARFASELNQKSATQNKEDYEKELRQLRNQQKKDRRDADEVSQVMVTECQSLLRLFGIPYITAPMEAEAQCAELVRLGLVDGIVTDDSDTFLFGGTRVYKNMFNSNKFVECYVGNDLEKEMSLGRQQLIHLAQLLGSDYTEGLPGVGPVTAVEILSEFPGESGLADFKTWWTDVQTQQRPMEQDADSTFRRKFRKSQGTKLFLPPTFPNEAVYDAYLHPEVDSESSQFQWGVPDVEGLRRFLMATIGWGKERTDEVLVPVIRDMNKRAVEGTQSNITRFFGGGVGAGAREGFAPRERVQGSKRMAAAVDKLRAAGGEKRKRRGEAVVEGGGDEEADEEEEEEEEMGNTSTRGAKSRGKRTRAP